MRRTVTRASYLAALNECKGTNDTVKVICGMRRSGKTSILEEYIKQLKSSGVSDSDIIYLDFEKRSGQDLNDADKLEAYLAGKAGDGAQSYVFLNNVCRVKDWRSVLLKLITLGTCDVYVTETFSAPIHDALENIAVKDIEVTSMSFAEFMTAYPMEDVNTRFREYAVYGGLPGVDPSEGERVCDSDLEGIFNTIILNDLILRTKEDPEILFAVTNHLFRNVGKEMTYAEIAKACHISTSSAERYVDALESAYLVKRVDRYDVNMGMLKEHPFRLYATDNGIRNFALKYDMEIDFTVAMENIVYLELLRRGYTVRAGSVHEAGVSFTVMKDGVTGFFHVFPSVETTDSILKDEGVVGASTILTMDSGLPETMGKARLVNLCDWLLN
ncbi:MAG: ATP-binding protein [Candidatus Methanomethylophilaceae archaeon]|nr:ATP-binding protein [Candidatus Methanomethylophilaceae archaeon]